MNATTILLLAGMHNCRVVYFGDIQRQLNETLVVRCEERRAIWSKKDEQEYNEALRKAFGWSPKIWDMLDKP